MNTENILSNLILLADSYKHSHAYMYPKGTEKMFSYIESRGGKYDETLFFGLQIFLKEYLSKPITLEMIEHADEFISQHIGPGVFNKSGWLHILNAHQGFLPILVKSAPEGLVIPTKNILVSIENTDEKCAWLTSFVETAILRAVWFPTTVATISYNMKKVVKKYLEKTADTLNSLPFGILDFSARGVSSKESSEIGSAAHLVNFMGTDGIGGILKVLTNYKTTGMPGFSVRASEHSTMTAYGKENEFDGIRNIVENTPDNSILSLVIDSFDCYKATEYLVSLKELIVKKNLQLTVRPDSGHPNVVLPRLYEILSDGFGYTLNSKVYKVLNHGVKILWGDGINPDTVESVLQLVDHLGYSTETIMLGCGGALVQKGVDRDLLKWAQKASAVKINGEWKDICKDPVTDPGKQSKKGRLMLYKDTRNKIYTALEGGDGDHAYELLEPVFENGKILKEYTFDEVRQNSEK